MIIFKNNYEDEKLFSTGDSELDKMLEEVYYSGIEDGYDYAQKEFGNNRTKKERRKYLKNLGIEDSDYFGYVEEPRYKKAKRRILRRTEGNEGERIAALEKFEKSWNNGGSSVSIGREAEQFEIDSRNRYRKNWSAKKDLINSSINSKWRGNPRHNNSVMSRASKDIKKIYGIRRVL